MVLDRFRKAVAERQQKTLDRPGVALRPDERMLLNALLAEPEIRAEVIGELRSIEAISRFATRRIFQTIFALEESGPFDFDAVNARLGEADQNLLAEAVLKEDSPSSREEILAAVRSMRRTQEQVRLAELRARIKELERAGNLREAMELMADLPKLEGVARNQRES
jgi:hypothetical protein